MPGTRCTVATCQNSLQKAKKLQKNIKFHRFPKDPSTFQIWVQKCDRLGNWNSKSCHVCSDHFKDDDYERDLQGELLGEPLKNKLKLTGRSRHMVKLQKITDFWDFNINYFSFCFSCTISQII